MIPPAAPRRPSPTSWHASSAVPTAAVPAETVPLVASGEDEHDADGASGDGSAPLTYAVSDHRPQDSGDVPAMDRPDDETVRLRRFSLPAHDDERAAGAIDALLSGSLSSLPRAADVAPAPDQRNDDELVDADTGLPSLFAWTRVIDLEGARASRYGCPVTVVIAELGQLDRLEERVGAGAIAGLIAPVADALRRNARAADRVARLGRFQFGVLLVETDEAGAINYVERVGAACERWLDAGAIPIRLSMGWASPATDGDLHGAARAAEERMRREQRRPAAWRREPPPSGESETRGKRARESLRAAAVDRPVVVEAAIGPLEATASALEHAASWGSGGLRSTGPTATADSSPPVAEALIALEGLRRRGLISEVEYTAKRTEILGRF